MNIDKEIERIFKKYDIAGDISFDETELNFWRRKFLELGIKKEGRKK